MKKFLIIAFAGVASICLGVGLYAWSANLVNVSGVTAGTGDVQVACTVSPLNLDPDTPVYVPALNVWQVSGGSVTAVGNVGDTCSGLTMTLSGVDVNGLFIGSGSTLLNQANGAGIAASVSFSTPADLEAIDAWTIVIE